MDAGNWLNVRWVCGLFAYHSISKRCRDDDVVSLSLLLVLVLLSSCMLKTQFDHFFYAWPFSNIVVKLNSCSAKHAEWVNEHKITAVAKCLLTRPEIRKRRTKKITFIAQMYASFDRLLANFFIYVHKLYKIRAKQTQSKGAEKRKHRNMFVYTVQWNHEMPINFNKLEHILFICIWFLNDILKSIYSVYHWFG